MAVRWAKLYKGTPAELALEPAVAALGLAYRTQLPGFLFGFRFFPDYFLPQLGLIIEVDDASHSKPDKIAADAERTEYLESRGWRVVRCKNEEALSDPHGAVQSLLREAGITPRDIELAKRRPVKMPQPARCPQKVRREMKSADRQASRRRGSPAPEPA
jgi:very-short-patch-repair endonuclease